MVAVIFAKKICQFKSCLKAHLHWQSFFFKLSVPAKDDRWYCPFLDHVGWCDRYENDPICVALPKVAKASKEISPYILQLLWLPSVLPKRLANLNPAFRLIYISKVFFSNCRCQRQMTDSTVLAWTTLVDATDMKMILFVLLYPRWPRQALRFHLTFDNCCGCSHFCQKERPI